MSTEAGQVQYRLRGEAYLAQGKAFEEVSAEFEKKDQQINMRVPKPLLQAVKARAKARGIPYTRFIRETLEHAIAASK